MGFSVEVDHLVFSARGVHTAVPADKTTLSPPKLKRNWDVKPGWGIEGAFCVYTGSGLASFDATFEFWNEEREAQWLQFAGAVLTAPTGIPAAIGIYHPVLIQPPFHITNVVVTEIEGWSLMTPGHWQARLSLLQYRKAKPFVPVKTEPGIPATQKVVPAKPQTEQDLRLLAGKAKLAEAAAAGLRNRRP